MQRVYPCLFIYLLYWSSKAMVQSRAWATQLRPETKDGPSELYFPILIPPLIISCVYPPSRLPRTSSSLPHGHQGGL